MSSNQKWKDKLLSSSFPLEYEAMRVLARNGFSISSEFTYSRVDGGTKKDFSVDIEALSFTPFGSENDLTGSVHLLVECKYRKAGTSWLFLPDPNEPGFSPFVLGQTIRAIDNFSMKILPPDCVTSFDENESLPFCFKGVEIDTVSSSAHDAQIKHGLSQLQYALPALFENGFMFGGGDPFFICPILLTNAPLYVANEDFSMRSVSAINKIDDIAMEVPYLVTYHDISPDFINHCINEFNENLHFDLDELEGVGEFRKSKGEYEHSLPIPLIESLISGETHALKGYFTQYIVCNWEHFPVLIKDLKGAISKAMLEVDKDT